MSCFRKLWQWVALLHIHSTFIHVQMPKKESTDTVCFQHLYRHINTYLQWRIRLVRAWSAPDPVIMQLQCWGLKIIFSLITKCGQDMSFCLLFKLLLDCSFLLFVGYVGSSLMSFISVSAMKGMYEPPFSLIWALFSGLMPSEGRS